MGTAGQQVVHQPTVTAPGAQVITGQLPVTTPDASVMHYTLLSVPRHASEETIHASYLQQAKLYHPDLSPSEGMRGMFIRLAVAYRVLHEVLWRREYDKFLDGVPGSREPDVVMEMEEAIFLYQEVDHVTSFPMASPLEDVMYGGLATTTEQPPQEGWLCDKGSHSDPKPCVVSTEVKEVRTFDTSELSCVGLEKGLHVRQAVIVENEGSQEVGVAVEKLEGDRWNFAISESKDLEREDDSWRKKWLPVWMGQYEILRRRASNVVQCQEVTMSKGGNAPWQKPLQ